MDFSIIIPAKNEEKNIGGCLQSISLLDYPREKFEVLVVDNGSLDNTVSIATSYQVTVYQKPDLSISGLRNFAAGKAKGKILAFLDADCTVFPDWLSKAAVWLDDAGVCCFGGPPEIPEAATWVQKSWFLVRQKRREVEDVDWLESMNMFVRRDVFQSVNGFDESLKTCEDYDLSLRLQKYGRLVADRRIRAVHHGEAATVGHFYRKEAWRGLSNLKGVYQHGFHWQELPSLCLPVIYIVCIAITILYLIAVVSGWGGHWSGFFIWVLCWQGVIFLLALHKSSTTLHFSLKLGLYFLFNLYFLARARAMLGLRG